ncbi:MAG: hypothetical protein GY756_08760 [bacterium]|nr:hypothetical protein [bacterium]
MPDIDISGYINGIVNTAISFIPEVGSGLGILHNFFVGFQHSDNITLKRNATFLKKINGYIETYQKEIENGTIKLNITMISSSYMTGYEIFNGGPQTVVGAKEGSYTGFTFTLSKYNEKNGRFMERIDSFSLLFHNDGNNLNIFTSMLFPFLSGNKTGESDPYNLKTFIRFGELDGLKTDEHNSYSSSDEY